MCGTSVLLVAGPPCTMDWRTCVQLLVDGRYASMCSRRRRTWLDMVVPPHLQAVMFDAASMSGRTTSPRASSCDVCGGSSWPCAVFKGTGSTLVKVFDPADHLGLTSSPPSGAQSFPPLPRRPGQPLVYLVACTTAGFTRLATLLCEVVVTLCVVTCSDHAQLQFMACAIDSAAGGVEQQQTGCEVLVVVGRRPEALCPCCCCCARQHPQ